MHQRHPPAPQPHDRARRTADRPSSSASASAAPAPPPNLDAEPSPSFARDPATLSPWTGVGSPGSSDFETISDAEVPPPTSSRSHATSNAPLVPPQSNLARSLSRRNPRTSSTIGGGDGFDGSVGPSAGRAASSIERSDDDHRRGIEGDDEDSSALEDVDRDEGGRGRARTRRVRDPELQKSMLEDALRSSLATLLSLAPAQATMSQSPALSHVSLASLFQPIGAASSASSSTAAGRTSLNPRAPYNPKRPSPFSTSLFDALGEDDEDDDMSGIGDNVLVSSSPPASSSSDEDEGTQLAPTVAYRSRAIPIVSGSSVGSEPSTSAASFSPLVASRPLGAAPGQPSSNSPPYYSRSRRGAAPVRRRGRGRGGSASPGPASVEERRRARERAAEEGVGAGVTSDGGGQRDEAFQDMVDAARFFSDLSPRASLRAPYSSLPSSYETARPRHPPAATTTSSWAPDTASSATSTPPYYSGDEDPALASESPPRLDLSSSGAEGESERSALPHAPLGDEQLGRATKRERDEGDEVPRKKQGWFGWWRAFGTTVELKVWHLVGICGVLLGVGLGASSLLHSLAPASWLASRLDFAHRAYAAPFLSPSSPAALASTAQSERSSPSSSSPMSSLFL
ncbi:hypothetical protein JCM9279_003009 [Rhodotorula babjevae]